MTDTNGGPKIGPVDKNVTTLIDEAKQAVRKELLEKFGVALVGLFISFLGITAAGWWLYLKPRIVDTVGGIPSGGIIALDSSTGCVVLGDSWEELARAQGRVIVGADSNAYFNGAIGGSDAAKINIDNLPELHVGIRKNMNSGNGLPYFDYVFDLDTRAINMNGLSFANSSNSATKTIGSAQPLKTMPPYLALHFCKRK